MKKTLIGLIALIMAGLPALASAAHGGRIYLQVEENGEAWYVNPVDNSRYYMANGKDAYNIMRGQGLGISDANIKKIPVGLLDCTNEDLDSDGLCDKLEEAVGTSVSNPDTDGDDYSDKTELENWTNPNGEGKLAVDTRLLNRLKGRILIQVEQKGAAWYLNPQDSKRYFLGTADDAYSVMRNLGIGITNKDLEKITVNYTKEIFQQAKHFVVYLPGSWTNETTEITENSKYRGEKLLSKDTFKPAGRDGFIEISVIQPNQVSGIKDFDYSTRSNANTPINKNIHIGVKPALRQYFKYPTTVEVNNIQINQGAEYFVTIMINTHKFILIKAVAPNESDITFYNKAIDQLLSNMKLVY